MKNLFPAFVVLIVLSFSCESDKDPAPKCKVTLDTNLNGEEVYTTNTTACLDPDGVYGGAEANGFEWNINVDNDTDAIFFTLEVVGGNLYYNSVSNVVITKSGDKYTFSADVEEDDILDEGTVSGHCSCTD